MFAFLQSTGVQIYLTTSNGKNVAPFFFEARCGPIGTTQIKLPYSLIKADISLSDV
jgi:hypothetical protein